MYHPSLGKIRDNSTIDLCAVDVFPALQIKDFTACKRLYVEHHCTYCQMACVCVHGTESCSAFYTNASLLWMFQIQLLLPPSSSRSNMYPANNHAIFIFFIGRYVGINSTKVAFYFWVMVPPVWLHQFLMPGTKFIVNT